MILAAACLLAPVITARCDDFSALQKYHFDNTAAVQDNLAVPGYLRNIRNIKPVAVTPGTDNYLFQLYGKDYNKHADWHMQLLSLYRHGGVNGIKPSKKAALVSIKALSLLGSGAAPMVTSADLLYWLPRQLSDVMKYGPDPEVRGAASLALGVVLVGKTAGFSKDMIDDLAFTMAYKDEEFSNRRFAVMALAGSRQKYAVVKLAEYARRSAAAHDFIGRGKFRFEEDETSWSLEASVIKAFESMLESPGTAPEALAALRYFADLSPNTCGDLTAIRLPADKNIDETLMVNARLVLAQNGAGVGQRYLSSNRDFPETGTARCLLPIVNDGDLCGLRTKASNLFREIHGDVISQTGHYVPGQADCTELITNKVMMEFAVIYLGSIGSTVLIDGAINIAKGMHVVAMSGNALKVMQYKKYLDMGYKALDAASEINNYNRLIKAYREGAR